MGEAKAKKVAAKKAAKAKKLAAKKAKKAAKKAKPSKKAKVLKKAKKPVKKVKKPSEIAPDVSSVVAAAFLGALSCGAVALALLQVRRSIASSTREPLLIN